MLRTLTVANFALIEQTAVDFDAGLNVLTGETGAGKSILIDAFSTILGGRAFTDSIRTNCDYFRVEAVFDISDNPKLIHLLENFDIPVESDGTLIISRKLSRTGKNSILVNGCHLPVHLLRQLGEQLVDIHGQHENQSLLRPEAHMTMLDDFNPAIRQALTGYAVLYEEWGQIKSDLTNLEQRAREREQRLDVLNWQTKEIAAAHLKVAEDEELEQEFHILANAEKIASSVGRADDLLKEGGKGFSGILSGLNEAKRELETAARYDERLQPYLAVLTDSLYQLEDVSMELSRYQENIDFNPARLNELHERLALIQKLKKKYGNTIEEILEFERQAVQERDEISNFEEVSGQLAARLHTCEQKLSAAADELDHLRRAAAKEMADFVQEQLKDLGMPKARFVISVSNADAFGPHGRNTVSFLFSANPGEEAKPLQKIASGGELSRVALAIKAVSAYRDSIQTMVFDEVDAGIGGQTANAVAEKIAMVGSGKQVLCITHLPQIASMADKHIFIEKVSEEQRTHTVIHELAPTERLRELARMVSGDQISGIELENAAQMVRRAEQKKEKWKNKAQD